MRKKCELLGSLRGRKRSQEQRCPKIGGKAGNAQEDVEAKTRTGND